MVKYNTDYNTKYNTNYNTICKIVHVNLYCKNTMAIWEYVHQKCIIFLFIIIIQLLLYKVHIN